MYLRFLDSDEIYVIENEIKPFASNKLCIYQSNIPENTSGFEIFEDDGSIIPYHDYTVVYSVSKKENKEDNKEEYIIFTSDTRIHNVYYTYDENGFVTGYISSVNKVTQPNIILVRSGIGSYYEIVPLEEILDEEDIPLYKVEDENIVSITEKDYIFLKNKKLQDAKDEKIAELSSVCERNITNGIEYNGEHFSYKLEDQNDLDTAFETAKTTGLSVPYHADDNGCKLYAKDEIFDIYTAQKTNLTHNKTYFNQLKQYVNSLNSINDIQRVWYGQELVDEYLNTYNEMMAQAQEIIHVYIEN